MGWTWKKQGCWMFARDQQQASQMFTRSSSNFLFLFKKNFFFYTMVFQYWVETSSILGSQTLKHLEFTIPVPSFIFMGFLPTQFLGSNGCHCHVTLFSLESLSGLWGRSHSLLELGISRLIWSETDGCLTTCQWLLHCSNFSGDRSFQRTKSVRKCASFTCVYL